MEMRHTIRFRVDFTASCSLGPGKIELLEEIQRTGSLRQAALALRMSYRRAWLLLDAINHSFTEPATTASVGGHGGGGVQLTPFGLEIVRCYRAASRAIETVARSELAPLAAKAVTGTQRSITAPRKRLPRSRAERR
jgi:molybdate transport system regulatory protein